MSIKITFGLLMLIPLSLRMEEVSDGGVSLPQLGKSNDGLTGLNEFIELSKTVLSLDCE